MTLKKMLNLVQDDVPDQVGPTMPTAHGKRSLGEGCMKSPLGSGEGGMVESVCGVPSVIMNEVCSWRGEGVLARLSERGKLSFSLTSSKCNLRYEHV